jgi:hypothetical protein
MKSPGLRALSVVTLLAFATSCASSTVIKTDPSGATVYIDGVNVGRTPYTHTDFKTVGTETHVKIEAEGYEEETMRISRSELDVPVLVGGIIGLICIVPGVVLLWSGKYRPEYSVDLTRRGTTARAGEIPPDGAVDTRTATRARDISAEDAVDTVPAAHPLATVP